MKISLLLASAALIAVATTGAAQAGRGHGVAVPTALPCPLGYSHPGDGCWTQVAGALEQFPNLFTDAAQSGQTYIANPIDWNAPFITTPSGPFHSRSLAVDPNLAGNHPSGCTTTDFNTGANTPPADYKFLDCSAPAAFTWPDLELGPINGHGPTFINYHNNTANAQVFGNIWFTEPDTCQIPASGGVLVVQQPATANFTVAHSDFDFNGAHCAFTTSLNGLSILTLGDTTVTDNHFKNSDSRNVTVAGGQASHITISANYFDDMGFSNAAHAEADTIGTLDNGPLASVKVTYNICRIGSDAGAVFTACMYLSNGVGGNLGNVLWDRNITFSNKVGGASAAAAGTVSGVTVDNGAGTGAGNIATIGTLTSGTLAPGSFLVLNNGTGGLGVNLMVNQTPGNSGSGSKWTVSCQAPASNSCPAGMGGSTASGSVVVPTSQQSGLSGTVNNLVMGPCVELAHNSYGKVTFTNNRCDTTGGTRHWDALTGALCKGPVYMAGNIDLVTGLPINTVEATTGGC